MITTAVLRVDVRVGDDLDHLYLAPSEPADQLQLLSIIKEKLPGVQAARTSSGIRLDAEDFAAISATAHGLELHVSDFVKRVIANRSRVRSVYRSQLLALRNVKEGGIGEATALISDCEGLTALDPHQIKNVAAMTLPEGFGLCLFDEQGAGKTVSLIFTFDLLVQRDLVDFALIVAPKSMVPEWPGDFSRFKSGMHRVVQLTGPTSIKRATIGRGADVFVTNFETVVAQEAHMQALLRGFNGRCMLVVDESFFIKSPDAKRTRALRRLREWCDRAYVLCGTPAPNAPQDVIQQFSLVDFGRAFHGVKIPEQREEALPVVQKVIEDRGLYLRNLKAAVLPDLPGKTFRKVILEMEHRQAAIYQDAVNNYIQVLEEVTEEQFKREFVNFLARRSALLQICSDPRLVTPEYKGVPTKITYLDSLLQSLILDQGEKVILWSFYTDTISRLVERYTKYGAVRYDGTVTETTVRRAAVDQFQNDDQTRLFIGNPAAAGAGLTLHRARVAVYESFSNQAAHYLQSLDRIHRRGQSRNVEYFILLCDSTIEMQEYQRLISKEESAQNLLGDGTTTSAMREGLIAEARKSLLS